MKKLVISLLLAGLVLHFAAKAEETAPKVGAKAPALKLPSLAGEVLSLQEIKKPVVLIFFTSWSKSCQAELKDLQQIYNSSFEVIAVSFDKKQKDLKTFISKNELSFPVLIDKKLSLLDDFQVLIIPTTFCLNKEGIIEKIFVDYDDNIKKAIEEWLKS